MKWIYITRWIGIALAVILMIHEYQAAKGKPTNSIDVKITRIELWVIILIITELMNKVSVAIAI